MNFKTVHLEQGTVEGRHYRDGTLVRLHCRAGRIVSAETMSKQSTETALPWIAPSLVDLQVNGYNGVDFQSDSIDVSELEHAVEGLQRDGCGRILLTLITDEWRLLCQRLERQVNWVRNSAKLGAAVVGWHIEGPFLSGEPGFCGAHDSGSMIDPSPGHMRELRRIVGDFPLLVTIAPERQGALETVREATRLGIRVSLGHTDASSDQLARSIDAGATGFTHLGNGCPSNLHRHENILVRVLDSAIQHVGIIPDKIHVTPAFFRLAHRVLGDRIYCVTDAMAAAGAGPGRYTLQGRVLEVGSDQIVRVPGSAQFAGSALRPMDGVIRAAEMLGKDWREVWDGFSVRPAEWMGIESGLKPGAPSHFCLVNGGQSA